MSNTAFRPLIALTMGDPAGIGPEVLVTAAANPRLLDGCRMVAFGDAATLAGEVDRKSLDLRVVRCTSIAESREHSTNRAALPCIEPGTSDLTSLAMGKVSAAAGQAAYDCLIAAARSALAGDVDGVTTAPLNKAALRAAGLDYPGHTEILGELCGVSDFGMMLYLPPGDAVRGPFGLGVVHTTLHTSIRSVPGLLTSERIAEKIGLMDSFLKRLGSKQPRVAVCALNPHAGEDGLFGAEESTIIEPAVSESRANGIDVTGPLPADTLLRRAVAGEFDGVVAMYHDQGHIALKLIGFDRAVNITLGLPIIRTSPSHGTGFDIAGQGKASAEGMIAAIRTAARLSAAQSAS